MLTHHLHRQRASWCWSVVASLLMALALWKGVWGQDQGPEAGVARTRGLKPPLSIMVHQGQLSVQLQEAELAEVLAQIAQQAGIAIVGSPRLGHWVSAQFIDIELAEGLRRLLRQAALSSAMRYASGPGGSVALTEVHVFPAVRGEAPRQHVVAEPEVEERPEAASHPFLAALAQISRGWSAAAETGESETVQRIRDLLESAPQGTRPPSADDESELAQPFRDALQRAHQRVLDFELPASLQR